MMPPSLFANVRYSTAVDVAGTASQPGTRGNVHQRAGRAGNGAPRRGIY